MLNLFAYTGGATMACASAGAAEVVHVDASKGMVNWAKENMMLSHLENHKIRFIVDDVLKFVAREKRRGRTYHAIIMDPPSYGRGPNGEIWKIEEQLYPLISACMEILDENPLFFLVNSYTTGFPPTVLYNLLRTTVVKSTGMVRLMPEKSVCPLQPQTVCCHAESMENGLAVSDESIVKIPYELRLHVYE